MMMMPACPPVCRRDRVGREKKKRIHDVHISNLSHKNNYISYVKKEDIFISLKLFTFKL